MSTERIVTIFLGAYRGVRKRQVIKKGNSYTTLVEAINGATYCYPSAPDEIEEFKKHAQLESQVRSTPGRPPESHIFRRVEYFSALGGRTNPRTPSEECAICGSFIETRYCVRRVYLTQHTN